MSNVQPIKPNVAMTTHQFNQLRSELNARGFIVSNRQAAREALNILSIANEQGSVNDKDLAVKFALQYFSTVLAINA